MSERRPIGRRLMGAAFLLLLAPMLGWWLATDYIEPGLRFALDSEQRAVFDAARTHTRMRLAGVLLASLALFALVARWARREIVAPLETLAGRAREASDAGWRTPAEATRADEIGDLASALDRSITELTQRAVNAQRAVADLGHELRTPLAAVRGAAEILFEDDLPAADRARFAANIVTESARLERLVAGLLDLERLRHGLRAPLASEEIDLLDLAREVLAVCEPLLARKSLDTRALGASALIATDPDRLRRLVFALLENAIKFSPADAAIEVSVASFAERASLSIRDAGPGIASAGAQLFTRGATTDLRGTGLGLAIASALAHALGAEIAAETPPGGGACFTVTLPLARP